LKKIEFYIVGSFLFTIFLYLSYSQPGSEKPIELKYADSLVGTRGDSSNIREFEGHVKFIQGNVTVYSDKATQFLTENRAELTGNVRVLQEDMVLKAPKIDWNGNTGLAFAYGGVEITDKNQKITAERGNYSTNTYIADFQDNVIASDDSVTINANRIQYNRHTRNSYAYGNVRVEDDSTLIFTDYGEYSRTTRESYAYSHVLVAGKYNSTYLSGDTVFNIPEKRYTVAKGNPVLNQIDTIRKSKKIITLGDSMHLNEQDSIWFEYDTLSVTCRLMEQFRDGDGVFLFKDSVRIVRNKLTAVAQNATFHKKSGEIILQGTPVVWQDSTQLHADSIVIFMPDNKLRALHSFGNALAATREDSLDVNRINQIIGNEIEIKFDRDTIQAIFSYGNAKSLYYMQNKDGEDGASRAACDTIFVEFVLGEAENIRWLGGIQGNMYPEQIIIDPKEYYLPNFRWMKDKPKLVISTNFLRYQNMLNGNKDDVIIKKNEP